MTLELLPLLAVQRELLNTAPGPARFKEYLAAMLDEDGEMVLPLAAFNPMSKPHVTVLLDTLLAMGAEEGAQAALGEATRRLGASSPALRVGLVVVDDARRLDEPFSLRCRSSFRRCGLFETWRCCGVYLEW